MKLNAPSSTFASSVVFLSSALWGLYWLPLRHLEKQGIDSGWAILLINAPAAIAAAFYLLWHFKRYKAELLRAFLIGLFTGLGLALYASGLIHSSVVRATLLFYLTCVWSTLIGFIWLAERANWQRWAAIFSGLAGLALIASGGSNAATLNIGDLFALFSGISWAIGAAMIKRFNQTPVPSIVTFQIFFTCIFALLLASLVGKVALPAVSTIVDLSPIILTFSFIVVLPTSAAIFWAQKFLFPGRVGLLMMSEVLVAIVSASILLPEESMSIIEWAGATLIICACLIEVFSNSKNHAS